MSDALRARSRAIRGVAGLAGLALVSACLKSTEPQPSLLDLNGSWTYAGRETGPVQETLSGTLEITRESGTSFNGRVDLEGVNTQTGATRVLSGLVSGTESGDVVDFDANLQSGARRHVGQIVADTITGTWVGSSVDGTMSTGTFKVVRETR